jgi:hypothetical protein
LHSRDFWCQAANCPEAKEKNRLNAINSNHEKEKRTKKKNDFHVAAMVIYFN